MNSPADIAALRAILATLYPGRADVLRVLSDVALDSSRINLEGSSVVRWHRTLLEAEKRGRLAAILDLTAQEYPESAALRSLASRIGTAS